MSKHHNSPPSTASPWVDILNNKHNVTSKEVSDAVAQLQHEGAAAVSMRIMAFNTDGGQDEADARPGTDGTTDIHEIFHLMAQSPINGTPVAAQVRTLDTGTDWTYASDILAASEVSD